MATVNVIMKMLDGSGDSEEGGGGGGNGNKKEKPGEEAKDRKGLLKRGAASVKKLTGLQFGFSAFLKQSQVFTSIIGSIFQLIGALVDVILGPFIPLLIPLIQFIAKLIPHVAKFAQMIADKLIAFVGWLQKMWDDPINTLKALYADLPHFIKTGLEAFWGWMTATGPIADIQRRIVQMAAVFPNFRIWLVKTLIKLPWTILSGLGKALAMFIKVTMPKIGGLLVKGFLDFKDKLVKAAKNILKGIWTKLGEVIGKIKIPGFGTLAKGIGSLGKGAKAVALGSKAVPVIGAAATLGFGAFETYRAYQKYGWKGAAAYGTKTLAATALTGFGMSPLGAAVDIGGSLALDQTFKLLVDQEHNDGTRTSQEITPDGSGNLAYQRNAEQRDY